MQGFPFSDKPMHIQAPSWGGTTSRRKEKPKGQEILAAKKAVEGGAAATVVGAACGLARRILYCMPGQPRYMLPAGMIPLPPNPSGDHAPVAACANCPTSQEIHQIVSCNSPTVQETNELVMSMLSIQMPRRASRLPRTMPRISPPKKQSGSFPHACPSLFWGLPFPTLAQCLEDVSLRGLLD
ncbi:U1 small nuclear ribonucleoprotein A, partial [Galemys pyrenaicus]